VLEIRIDNRDRPTWIAQVLVDPVEPDSAEDERDLADVDEGWQLAGKSTTHGTAVSAAAVPTARKRGPSGSSAAAASAARSEHRAEVDGGRSQVFVRGSPALFSRSRRPWLETEFGKMGRLLELHLPGDTAPNRGWCKVLFASADDASSAVGKQVTLTEPDGKKLRLTVHELTKFELVRTKLLTEAPSVAMEWFKWSGVTIRSAAAGGGQSGPCKFFSVGNPVEVRAVLACTAHHKDFTVKRIDASLYPRQPGLTWPTRPRQGTVIKRLSGKIEVP